MTSATERATPYYCPYCGDEDLRPIEEPRGAWRCTACLRAFVVTFAGLTAATPETARTAEIEVTS